MPHSPIRFSGLLFLATIGLTAGCRSDSEVLLPVEVPGLIIPAQPQDIGERQWIDVSLRELYRIPRDTSVTLYMPGPFRIGPHGSLFYIDPGDMKIKQFDRDGNFVQSFGGRGEGPGEFHTPTDLGFIGDSVLYVNDPNRRRVHFFSLDNAGYLRAESSMYGYRYRLTDEGRAYWLHGLQDSLFGTALHGRGLRGFGTLIENQDSWNTIVVSGRIIPFGENIIHVPSRFPALFQWDSTGTLVYARTTPDFGHVPAPELDTQVGPLRVTRPRGRSLNGHSAIYDDELVVYAFLSDTTKAFDVYSARTGDYRHSVLMPWGLVYFATYDPIQQHVWQVRDTTTVVYEVSVK